MTALQGETEVAVPPTHSGRSGRLQHLPALDGLRGVAVVAVLFFHGGFRWAKGGWLGVSVFFTLSGFLITNLLVAEWASDGSISLKTFWSRRFRRLMPAALACLLLVALYGQVWASPEQLRHLRGDLLAAVGYVANWRFLFSKLSYADLFSAPSPVQHFWSLAIEEQFYVFYPLVAFATLRFGGRRLLTAVLATVTAGSLLVAFVERGHLDRVYYGTDTRMTELLAGALLALWWSARPERRAAGATTVRRVGIVVLGLAGLAASLVLWPRVGQADRFVTHGVLPLQAVLSVAMIAAAARPGVVARVFSIRPLTAIGLVSYGLYLYHWPVFLVLDHDRTGLGPWALFVVRVAVTTGITMASYFLLEQPIRRRRVLLRASRVFPAVAAGVGAVVVSSVAVTWSLPPILLAHANVQLKDQKILVQSNGTTGTTLPGAPPAVMIVGDSGTFDAAPAIGAEYQAMGTPTIVDATFPGFGLTREPSGWEGTWPGLVDQHNVQLTVVMLGGWDEGYLADQGRAAYDRLLERAVSILTARGGKILWLGMLPGPNTDVDKMDGVFRDLANRHPGVVAYGEIGTAVIGPKGDYPRWIPGDDGKLVLARKPDGWHLCPDGAARIARRVATLTSGDGWSPTPVTGWEQGSWRSNPRYDDPKGGCDVNRPSNAPPSSG